MGLLRKDTNMRLLLLLAIFFAALTVSSGVPVPQRGRRPGRGPGRGPSGRRPPPGGWPGRRPPNNNNGFTGPLGGNLGTVATAAPTIVLSSTAVAAEYWGDLLGEFMEEGTHNQRPYYKQKDTEGNNDTFLYSEGGEWLVSDALGKSSDESPLINQQNTTRPPMTHWKYWDGEQDNDNDTSLTLEFTALSPCKLVKVSGRGEVVKKQPDSLGVYRLEEGRWSKGRPVFKKVSGELRFLSVAHGWISWSIRRSTSADDEAFIESGIATNSPSSPEAGHNVHYGTTRWMYAEDESGSRDDDGWREDDIHV